MPSYIPLNLSLIRQLHNMYLCQILLSYCSPYIPTRIFFLVLFITYFQLYLFFRTSLQFAEYEFPSGANCSLGHLPVLYVVCWLFLMQLPNTSLLVVLGTLLPTTLLISRRAHLLAVC